MQLGDHLAVGEDISIAGTTHVRVLHRGATGKRPGAFVSREKTENSSQQGRWWCGGAGRVRGYDETSVDHVAYEVDNNPLFQEGLILPTLFAS
jgi:hypothetical protein